ncbi:selenium metabolism-associated LysR family transcriptional regulator [Bacillus sp. FJAT-44742]|uniref:selenium metabolism-associated LysR family transcriptional regulator n=1 Tax=Bacillus sp. FJAT-44742 TaxID=2014005 RepID=UPI000C24091C|nr:selenium metabolism-associated LysR family transcriptional regulator [Bacillus sp. FJAT-44742]
MNLEHLKTFISVADKKSFSATARALHLSQPTVTQQIKALEKHLNINLFERSTKQVELTSPAKVLYRYAKEIVKLNDIAEHEIMKMTTNLNGRLEVACSLTIGDNILPKVLGTYKKQFPHVLINIDITNTSHIVDRIKAKEIDLGLIEAPVHESELMVSPFMEDELVLVSSPSFFPQDKSEVSVSELPMLPFILREKGSGTRIVMEKHLYNAGLNPDDINIAFELGSTEAIKASVEAGLGVSILSETAIEKELTIQTLKKHPITGISFTRHFYLIYHRDTFFKEPVQAFVDTLHDFVSLITAKSINH